MSKQMKSGIEKRMDSLENSIKETSEEMEKNLELLGDVERAMDRYFGLVDELINELSDPE